MLENQPAVPDGEDPLSPRREQRTFQQATRDFQRDLLWRTLQETDWNVTEAARRLDLARSHVYNLIRAFGFRRDGGGPGGVES